MYIKEFDRLEGQLPVTGYPFKSTITCSCYKQEQPQTRNDLLSQLKSRAINTTPTETYNVAEMKEAQYGAV
jgi:hypothetical protein